MAALPSESWHAICSKRNRFGKCKQREITKAQVVMAQQFDWLVIGRNKDVTNHSSQMKDTPYDLLNSTISKVHRRRVREGIDLEYVTAATVSAPISRLLIWR
jgi:hypothetical protein